MHRDAPTTELRDPCTVLPGFPPLVDRYRTAYALPKLRLDPSYLAKRRIEVGFPRLLPVVYLDTVQVDLQSSISHRGEGDRGLPDVSFG